MRKREGRKRREMTKEIFRIKHIENDKTISDFSMNFRKWRRLHRKGGGCPYVIELTPTTINMANRIEITLRSEDADVMIEEEAKEERTKNAHIILKNVIVGHFAMWAVRQSPYLLPENLEKGIEEFNEYLISNIEAGDENIIETTYTDLVKNIKKAISNSNTILSWNIAKKGTGNAYVSVYSKPKPDYDFIDPAALARNITQSVWLESAHDDEEYI